MHHNHWACALEPGNHNYWDITTEACSFQLQNSPHSLQLEKLKQQGRPRTAENLKNSFLKDPFILRWFSMSRPLIYLKRFLQWFFKSWIIIKQLLKFNTTHQWYTWKSERRRLFLGYNDFSSFPPPRQNSMILNIYNSTVMFFFLSSFNLSGPWYTALITLLLFSLSVVSDSLRPHRLQHARLSCSPPSPGACSNSCPLNQRFHPTIRSSVILFSSGLNLSQHQGLF